MINPMANPISKLVKSVSAMSKKEKDLELQRFLREQSQVKLAAQLDLMKGADTRAQGLLTISVTLSGAALAAAVSKWGTAGAEIVFWAAVGFGLCAGFAGVAAVAALWPASIYIPGWQASQFKEELDRKEVWADVEPKVTEALENRILDNAHFMRTHAWRTQLSMTLVGASPISGASAALFAVDRPVLGTLSAVAAAVMPFIVFIRRAMREKT